MTDTKEVVDVKRGPFDIGPGRPIDPTVKRGSAARRRFCRVLGVVIIMTAISTLTAIHWPIHEKNIQASFFVALVASSLTLFGLVFTLCLIGAQMIVTRTNISLARTFGILTWPYLALFLLTTLWTLEFSYYAGNQNAPLVWFRLLGHNVSQVLAGRISIFGLTLSLLLLLPFIYYINKRLSQHDTFSSLVSSALRARNIKTLEQRCQRIRDEIISVNTDPRAATEGLRQLLDLGVNGAQHKRFSRFNKPDEIAKFVSGQFRDLNNQLIGEPMIRQLALQAFQAWTCWLICEAGHSGQAAAQGHSVSQQRVGEITRDGIKIAARNLARWEDSTSAETCARESVTLVRKILEASNVSRIPIRVKISEPAIQLANCVSAKLIDGPRSDFNLAFRGLIKICELTSTPTAWSLGGAVALRQTTRALKILGEANASRAQLSGWILDELHNLADALSMGPVVESEDWKYLLSAIAQLKTDEIRTILRGPVPGVPKSHKYKGKASHSWEAVVIGELHSTGSSELLELQKTAVGRCVNDSDLSGLVGLLEHLAAEYVNDDLPVQSLITTTVDSIRTSFIKNPTIALSRKSRYERSLYAA